MTVKWENSWFTVRILLPIPEKNKCERAVGSVHKE